MRLAARDLDVSEGLLGRDADWVYAISYNAMLQAGRALMFSRGYRPASEAQHVAVVQFAAAVLSPEDEDLAAAFDLMRRRRHRAVYDTAGSVSESEARRAIRWARQFVGRVERLLAEGATLDASKEDE
jgi:uncharacterized protein (UPF0332 family)